MHDCDWVITCDLNEKETPLTVLAVDQVVPTNDLLDDKASFKVVDETGLLRF